jgi:hypothetical protein
MSEFDEAQAACARLAAARGKARYPNLGLWRFVAEVNVLLNVDNLSDKSVPEGSGKTRKCAEPR